MSVWMSDNFITSVYRAAAFHVFPDTERRERESEREIMTLPPPQSTTTTATIKCSHRQAPCSSAFFLRSLSSQHWSKLTHSSSSVAVCFSRSYCVRTCMHEALSLLLSSLLSMCAYVCVCECVNRWSCWMLAAACFVQRFFWHCAHSSLRVLLGRSCVSPRAYARSSDHCSQLRKSAS